LSDIFKKITSIEPVDSDALDALKFTPKEAEPKRSLLRPLPEDMAEDDPVPEFITRRDELNDTAPQIETPKPATAPIIAESLEAEAATPEITKSEPTIASSIASAPAALASGLDIAPSTRWMKWAGIIAVLVWLGASFAYLYGFFAVNGQI